MKKSLIITISAIIVFRVIAGPAEALTAKRSQDTTPWWKQQKIIFMWGQWIHDRQATNVVGHRCDLSREVFSDLAQAGATVFSELQGYSPKNAHYAHEFGLKYFATVFVSNLHTHSGRTWAQESGKGHYFKCPLDEVPYESWLVEPHLEGAKAGLIDGIHIDWERYGGKGEATGICYCDDCFSTFLKRQTIKQTFPDKAKRFQFLLKRNLVGAYEENFHRRRIAMFINIRRKLQTANPDLMFSSYGLHLSDFSRAMNTPDRPFIFLDCNHYVPDSRKPWWESYGSRLRKEGYIYIPGGWINYLFGAGPSQVSAARWIYETSVNEDGCWLWFERDLDDEILRAYATADRQIKDVEHNVGKYLLNGKRDSHFVTTVEWTGRPELKPAVITQTYHLGREHLTHVNNVDSDWPLRTRLRFSHLPRAKRWTVSDPMSGLYYSGDGKSAVWTSEDLLAGVVIALDPRSDLFLLVSPADAELKIDTSRMVHSRQFDRLPDHEAASQAAGPIKAMARLYTMKNSIYGEKLDSLRSSAKKVFDLPRTGWMFKMDKDDLGAGQSWYLPNSPLDGWIPIEIEKFWGGNGSTGAGWYCANIDIPDLPRDKRIYLHFDGVDEHLVLWIDGKYAGDHDRAIAYWDKPFAIDVTEKLTAGRHHIAMRVFNVGGAGGVFKPVSVFAGHNVQGTANFAGDSTTETKVSGSIVYTATEPMGFGGAEGGLTIGNVIRTVDADGKNQLRIRQLSGHLWSPRRSPDGKRIAFVHNAGGRGQIFVMRTDGSEATNLSNNGYCDRSPRWSPDGKEIAFVSDRTGDWDIYVMSADGSSQRCIAGNPGLDRGHAWSPDGMRILWVSHVSGMPNIWVCDADGSSSRPLITPDKPLTIQKSDFDEKDQVFNFVDVKGIFPDNSFYLMNPVWSPDSKQIAAVVLRIQGGRHRLVVIDADGSRMLRLVNKMAFVGDLIWSPDGKFLAGCGQEISESERTGLFVIRADGTDEKIRGKSLIDVGPQGPRLGGAQRHGLMTWYSHGSAEPRRVVKSFYSLAFSPDGKSIAFSSDMDPSGAFYVYTVPAAGGSPTKLEATKSAWPNQIDWLREL